MILTGALREVSLLSQVFSIPSVIERNNSKSQTTTDITKTDVMAIKETENCFFLGIKYFFAMKNSNI